LISTESEEKTFREFHNEFRRRNRRGRAFSPSGKMSSEEADKIEGMTGIRPEMRKGRTYVRPKVEGQIKGKAALKAAKRERVRQMRAAVVEDK